MSTFETEALRYFRDHVGIGAVQRIDGIACFSKLSRFWFWELRLAWMAKKGLLIRQTRNSLLASQRNMPWYGISKARGEQ